MQDLLQNRNANPNFADDGKRTTMYYAAKNENLSMMALLINNKFDYKTLINTKDNKYGDSVFLQLCSNGNLECLKYILDTCNKYVDIMVTDNNNNNGLHVAIYDYKPSNGLRMIEYLLDNIYLDLNNKNIILYNKNRFRRDALCVACEKNEIVIVKYVFYQLKRVINRVCLLNWQNMERFNVYNIL